MTKQVELNETTMVLIKARELLEKGWCKGALRIGDSYCMSGAIWYAGGGTAGLDNPELHDRLIPTYGLVWVAIGAKTAHGIPRHSIPYWNDQLSRTKEDVLLVMDKAIALSMGVPELMVAQGP